MFLKEALPELFKCYQCLSCTLGCPLAEEMDFKPHQLVNLLILGKDKEVLNSLTPWICASCESCEVRCPNGVPLSELMDRIRQRALKEKIYKGKGFSLPLIFLKEIKKRGRIHEISLILGLKRLVGFKVSMEELRMGLRMFLKGKLRIRPLKRVSSESFKRIFEEVSF